MKLQATHQTSNWRDAQQCHELRRISVHLTSSAQSLALDYDILHAQKLAAKKHLLS